MTAQPPGAQATSASCATFGLPQVPAAPPRALPTINSELLQNYLERRFAGDAPRVRSIRALPGGRSKRSFAVSVDACASLPQQFVLRQDKPDSAQRTKVCHEFPVMQALRAQGVSVAQPLWLEANSNELGPPFFAMGFESGDAPGNYWSAGAASAALGDALADTLAALHQADAARAWPQSPRGASDCVAEMVFGCEARWRANGAEISDVAERAFDWLRSALGCIDGHCAPVHGDVHFGNVLATGERIQCLTDWEFAHAGHPSEDVAFCRSYIESIMPWERFLERYRRAGGRDVSNDQMQFFRIWTYLRNLSFAAGLRQNLLQVGAADLQSLVIVIDALPRLERSLAHVMAEVSGESHS